MRIAGSVDTEKLPADEAQNLQQMLDAAKFFELPAAPAESLRGADRFQYKLTVESDEGSHTVELSDEEAPDEIRPLLRRLTVLARSQQGGSSP